MTDPSERSADSRTQPDETLTRRAVARYAVLDTPPEDAFNELVDLALTVTGARAGGIAFLDRERVWFKSRRGLAVPSTPRARFPVSWGGRGPQADRERHSPTGVITVAGGVTLGEESFANCLSAPIITGDGYHVGQFVVLDVQTLPPDHGQQAALAMLAHQVLTALELRRTMMSYRAAVDGAGHVVFQLDERHRLLSVTPTWGQLTGFGVVRSVGRPLAEFVHPGDRTGVRECLDDLHHRNVASTFECRLLRLIGGDVPVEVIARPVIDEAGVHRGLVGVIADISERKAREVEAQHAQKLEALGRLSAGLAHEINTPIQFVGDNTRFLASGYQAMLDLIVAYRRTFETAGARGLGAGWQEAVQAAEVEADLDYLETEIPEAISHSLEGIGRVATLVRAMKTFSKADHEAQAGVDLNDALQAAVTVAVSQVQHVARIECDFGDLPVVMCTIGDLNQVFLNMIVNAADAIEEKGEFGTITVRTRPGDDQVVIEICDTGTGMPEETRRRIFEPFFTTKDVGRGTGQGLTLARAVVQDKHGGSISVQTEVGVGTTFTLRLPVGGRATTSG